MARSLRLVAVLVLSTACYAEDAAVRARQLKTANQYVAALRADDFSRAMALFHPKMRACMNDQNRAFFHNVFEQHARRQPKSEPRKVTVKALDPKVDPLEMAFLSPENFSYPAKPTYSVEIEFPPEGTKLYSEVLALAPEGDGWYVILPCPTEAGLKVIERQEKKRAEQEANAAKLASEIQDPLRSQLQDLLSKQQRIAAIKAYQQSKGVDMSTAVQVMDAFEAQQKK
jgi:predicted secreted protein